MLINDESLGSIEYAVDHLAVRLTVALWHQSWDAVKAAKEMLAAKAEAPGAYSVVGKGDPAGGRSDNRWRS